MSKENVMKFEEKIMKDEEFQKRMEEAAKAYEGDQKDEKAVFEAVIVPVAKEAGLTFTFEELSEARKAVSDGEIDLKDMKAVGGGALRRCGFRAFSNPGCGLYAELSGERRN
ncbi:MAG: Nif11-like leader peptide family natural product precursor [Lachnospiraceae bacterium]|nr:Nif11-like leader peptide family natural product precursor [Lachnospiraceae bacterium]